MKRIFLVILIFLFNILSCSQMLSQLKPSARFSFNKGSDVDEINNVKAKLVGVNYVPDRFNNEKSAVFIYGNQSSFINLGNYPALKPLVGSISMWVKMDVEVWAGSGHRANPIILTKRSLEDDFYEAYAIYYSLEGGNVSACLTRDSLKQIAVSQSEKFKRFEWQHLAFTYNEDSLSFYINGKLVGSLATGFRTVFNESDSVLVGITANQKNNRYFNGTVDDIEFFDRVLSPEEINQLYKALNPNRNAIILNWAIYILGLLCLVALVYLLVKYRLSLTLKKEKKQLELYNIILETELRVNRALMNPHFVFNSLNALQNFILKNENERANHYLVKFSKLMRKILESNMSDQITVEFEIELLNRYLEIEDLRFEEDIQHTIEIEPGLQPSNIHIPIMMIQPFVENAIWHGLLKKDGQKTLSIRFSQIDDKYVECIVEDNGLGRKEDEEDVLQKKSLATSFVMQRLELLNRIHNLQCSLTITDKPQRKGTIVKIILPLLRKNK